MANIRIASIRKAPARLAPVASSSRRSTPSGVTKVRRNRSVWAMLAAIAFPPGRPDVEVDEPAREHGDADECTQSVVKDRLTADTLKQACEGKHDDHAD